MDGSNPQWQEIQALRSNFTVADDDWEHLLRCWSRQSCESCLDAVQCSWCPYTWSCVPNTHSIPLLAPVYQSNICPHPDERWELRTKPFGCRASSFTTFAIAIAVLSTFALVLLLWLCGVFVRFCRRRRPKGRWLLVWEREGETAPLLAPRNDAPGS